MKTKIKKILFSLGALTVVSAPIISVVSCGDNNKSENKNEPLADMKVNIDLENVTSITDLITQMNDSMHFIMKNPADVMGKPITDTKELKKNNNFPLTQNQYREIANGVITDNVFKLSYKGQSIEVKSNFEKDTLIINEEVTNMLNNWTPEQGTQASERMTKNVGQVLKSSPNISAAVAMLTMMIGLQSSGFLSLPETAWVAYQNELENWTNFTYAIKSSDVFQSWVADKKLTYTLPNSGAPANEDGQIDAKDLNSKVAPGSMYDDPKVAPGLAVNPNNPKKISNLEIQFGYMIQNLYA